MKKFIYGSFYLALFCIVSCTEEDLDPGSQEAIKAPVSQQDPLAREEINELIEQQLSDRGDFDWSGVSDHVLWSALQHGDSIMTIGYGFDESDFTKNKTQKQATSKNGIIEIVKALEDDLNAKTRKQGENILIYEDEYLTVIDLKIGKLETVAKLRNHSGIRFMEPSGYSLFQQEPLTAKSPGSGCGFESDQLNSTDYHTIAPNAKMPWNFPLHGIDGAWAYSTGKGVTIGIVDTGLSPDQPLLNNSFNSGYSSGRSIEKYGVFVDSFWPWSKKTDGPNDKCGHGTSMIAAATAPRNNAGRPVGVAYNANLVSYRASGNVLLNSYQEQKGVARAMTALGRRNDVKIISMSMGYVFSIRRIEDAIRYAHDRGKIIFVAGGTSTRLTNFVGVTFPGSMSETIAVTGVEEGAGYDECDVCHYGSKIDCTIVMERSSTNKHVPVLGYYNGSDRYVGGSSVATATAAGIAALVWSKNPSWTRDQVLHKLMVTADLYPNKSADFGWGNLNALAAVR